MHIPFIYFIGWLQIRPDLGRIEKWILRNAFDDEQKPYLPKVCDILTFCTCLGILLLRLLLYMIGILLYLILHHCRWPEWHSQWEDFLSGHFLSCLKVSILALAHFVQAEGTVQWWSGLQLDWRLKGSCRQTSTIFFFSCSHMKQWWMYLSHQYWLVKILSPFFWNYRDNDFWLSGKVFLGIHC